MDLLQKVYETNKNTIIGSNFDYVNDFQQKLINNFNLDRKILQKNESTKHIDQKFITSLNYNFKNSDTNFKVTNNKSKPISSIIVNNGHDYFFNNIKNNEVIFNPLKLSNDLIASKIKKYKDVFIEDYVVNLNSILHNSGFEFILNENSSFKTLLLHPVDEFGSTVYAKNYFTIKKNSKLFLIEKISNNTQSNSNIINYFDLEEGSEVIHLVIQSNFNQANLQFSSHVKCNEGSFFNQFIFNCSDTSSRNHHYVDMLGQNCEAKLNGVFFGSNNQIIDNKTNINHLNIDCKSNQTYKGILTDDAKASYLSKTYVDKIAQKTEGYQLSKGILLSDNAFFHSKPELKIYADDVKCSHGSTIGPFDNDKLFYLRTRGISEKKARSLLIKSFYQDLLNSIKEQSYLDEVNDLVNIWLHKNIS